MTQVTYPQVPLCSYARTDEALARLDRFIHQRPLVHTFMNKERNIKLIFQ